jgi:signal transduction histidine kinase
MKINTKISGFLIIGFFLVSLFLGATSVFTLLNNQRDNIEVSKNEFLEISRELMLESANFFFRLLDKRMQDKPALSTEDILRVIPEIDPSYEKNVVVIDAKRRSAIPGYDRAKISNLLDERAVVRHFDAMILNRKKDFYHDNYQEYLADKKGLIVPTAAHFRVYEDYGLIIGYGRTMDAARVRIEFMKIKNEDYFSLYLFVSLLIYTGATIIAVMVLIYIMKVLFISPLKLIGNAVKRVAGGDLQTRITIQTKDEIGELAGAFNQMTQDLQRTTTSIDNLNWEIAERKKAEEEREKLLHEVEKANQNKTQFVSNVSHELRTPMASIKGFISTIRSDPNINPAVREDFMKIIEDEADRLNRIIEDLLDLSRIESGRIKLKKEKIKLTDIIKKSVGTIREQAAQKHLALKTELPEELPYVFADSDKMSQIIINLLSNAIKYTKEGEVMISARQDDGHVRVEVSDTGIGIVKEDLPKVFEKFQRFETPGIEAKGTGLGLSIVKAIVELHDGKVFVESEPGRGSTFGFELPVIKE